MIEQNASNSSGASARRPLAEVEKTYREREQKFSKQAEALDGKSARIGNFRGLTFAALAISAGVYLSKGYAPAGALALCCVVLFAWLVQYHAKVLAQEAEKRRFAIVNEHALARLTGKWHNLPRAGITFAPKDHGYTEDLDLFGTASLYQRLSVAHTRYGQTTLAKWLSQPAPLDEIKARHGAVLELAPLVEFRQALEAEGMALVEKKRGKVGQLTDGPNPHRLLSWINSPPKIAGNLLITSLSWLIPLASVAGIYAQIWHKMPPYLWLAPLASGVLLLTLTKEATSESFAAVSTTEGAFLRYGSLLSLLENFDAKSDWLKQRVQKLLTLDVRPSEVMRRFRRLVSWYDLRHNGMVYPFVNALLLWDLHCTRALENWKKDVGQDLHRWFEVIGDVEAVSSLSALYADDPGASIPDVFASGSDGRGLFAEQLGHPLLSASGRVENQVEDLKPGEALLVTGSNMSGKSTFLRALGVNAVLAFAGGPVIASHMRIPLCRLGTSIRVSDSLKSGVSHFYAEIQKLALVVKTAEQGDLPVLFLLDEILHGTNSRERQIGARWVLSELLKKQAFGVITTHDMELCRLPDELMAHVRQHHFRESVKDGEMTFDYTLREGPVTSGNALRLMRRVGLEVPLED